MSRGSEKLFLPQVKLVSRHETYAASFLRAIETAVGTAYFAGRFFSLSHSSEVSGSETGSLGIVTNSFFSCSYRFLTH